VENEGKVSTPSRHSTASPVVQVMHWLQGESPSPAGITTWTIAQFFEVILDVKFPLFNMYIV